MSDRLNDTLSTNSSNYLQTMTSSDHLHTTISSDYQRTTTETVFLVLSLHVVTFFAIFGNIAVIFAIAKTTTLREEVSNRLTINLAITDLANGSIVMLSSIIASVSDKWTMGSMFCDFICALNYCLIITSMLTLCFISVDRYQAILHPLKYQVRVTTKHMYTMIAYSWSQGIVFSIIPPLLKWVEFDYWEVICAIQWQKEKEQAVYYVITAFILCFLTPGIILIFNYVIILREVRKSTKIMPLQSVSTAKKKYSTSSKAVRSLLIVVFAYFVCMTPFSVTKLIKVLWNSEFLLKGNANTVASVVGYCSSAINPLIYGIFRRDFRSAYRKLFCRLLRNNVEQTNIDTENTNPIDNNRSMCR